MKTFFFKLFLVFSLFFPAFWSSFREDYKMEYYAVFTAAYACILLWMLVSIRRGGFRKNRFCLGLAIGLLLYNVLSLWFNIRSLHWFGEEINNTIAFIFFLFLCIQEEPLGEKPEELIRFFLGAAVLSNALSILYYFAGYTSFLVCNNHIYLIKLPEDYYEFRHYWLYSHKSDYALILNLFLAAVLRFRPLFRKIWTFVASILILLAALFLSHSWTGFGAAFLVFLGAILDQMDFSKLRFQRRYIPICGAGLLILAAGGKLLLKERDIFSMGARGEIWTAAIRTIRSCPGGWGLSFGEQLFEVHPGWSTNNCHNIFLNAMLRFSVPVGVCFLLLMLAILTYAWKKSGSFLGKGLILGTFALMNMDYSLLNYELGMFLFVIWLVCIYKRKEILNV